MNIAGKFQNQKLNTKFTTLIIVSLMVVIGIFAGIFFHLMEQNVITENYDYMESTAMRNQDGVRTRIDSINMSTQFFLSDAAILEVLNRTMEGENITTAEWVEFKNEKVAALERLVNNNPFLYSVRVYAANNYVQEMMPILYRKDRMYRQAWSSKDSYSGWNYNYTDNIFPSYTINQDQRLVALITPVVDRNNGQIGTIEAAMTMENMFPNLYEGNEDEWSCFVTNDGKRYSGDANRKDVKVLLDELIAEYEDSDTSEEIETKYLKPAGRNVIVAYMPMNELGGMMIYVRDITKNIRHVYGIRNVFVALMLLLLLLLAFLINGIVQHLLKQFYEILYAVRRVQTGELGVRIRKYTGDEMGELSDQLNTMLDHIQKLMQDNINREILAKNSEIRALQNQINAHFIYNVLETIKMMAEIDEEYAISDAVTSLGKLLRYSMRWTSGNVKVEEELEYIKNYVALINLRFDYEILLSLKLPEEVRMQEIPKMSLQPIVENAILHGIEDVAEDTTIYIKGYIDGDDCVIEITDGGKGMNAVQVDELKKKIAGRIETSGGSGNGIGLKNVQDRIAIAFGRRYGLDIVSKKDCYTKVIVRLPHVRMQRTPEELEAMRLAQRQANTDTEIGVES